MRRLLSLMPLVLLSSCLTRSAPDKPANVAPGVSAKPGVFSRALGSTVDARMVSGNQAVLVNNGAIFRALEDEARAARSSIHLDVFIWSPSDESLRLAEVVAERARAGIRCRVLVDPFGSLGFDNKIAPILQKAGCEVRDFHGLGDTEPGKLTNRNHRKIAVFDGRIGYTGGFGLDKEWKGDARNEDEWRDTNIRVEGPVVTQVQQAFFQDWQEAGGDVPEDAFRPPPSVGSARAAFVMARGNVESRELPHNESVIRLLIAAAHKRLWIANAYFVPSDEILELLAAKAKEGVDVRVLIPGPHVDSKFEPLAQKASIGPLIEAGVKVFEYQPTMMHAKTALVDESLVAVGSINLDPFSLKVAREDALIVQSDALARQFEHDFREDLTRSKQVTDPPRSPINSAARHLFWMLGKHL